MYPQTLIKKYLDQKNVPYEHHVHGTVFTAQEVAEQEWVPGAMVAKTLVVKKGDSGYAMAVLPASMQLDLRALKDALGVGELRLATESEFKNLFPDSDIGAMPPFGNLYGLPVYVEKSLTRDREIVFNAGTHEDTIRMKYADFDRLVEPEVHSFAMVRAA